MVCNEWVDDCACLCCRYRAVNGDEELDEGMDPTVADITQRRMRSRTPTDEEILNNVMLTCLDTGKSARISPIDRVGGEVSKWDIVQ